MPETYLAVLLRKFEEDPLFRRLAIGSPTFSEMVAEAIMKDRTGQDHLATHNAPPSTSWQRTGSMCRSRWSAHPARSPVFGAGGMPLSR